MKRRIPEKASGRSGQQSWLRGGKAAENKEE